MLINRQKFISLLADPGARGPPVLRGRAVPPGVHLAADAAERALPRTRPRRDGQTQALPRQGTVSQLL